MTNDPAIVEVAAKAIDWGTHKFLAGSPDWRVPSCRCGWKASAPYAVLEFDQHLVELVLEVAAPLIVAKTLDKVLNPPEPADIFEEEDWQDEYDRKAEEYFAEYPKDDWSEMDRDQW